jgi:hypothetical protein
MLYREIIVVQYQNYTKHIKGLCGKDSQFLVLKMAVGALGTKLWRIFNKREKPITGTTLQKRYKKRYALYFGRNKMQTQNYTTSVTTTITTIITTTTTTTSTSTTLLLLLLLLLLP